MEEIASNNSSSGGGGSSTSSHKCDVTCEWRRANLRAFAESAPPQATTTDTGQAEMASPPQSVRFMTATVLRYNTMAAAPREMLQRRMLSTKENAFIVKILGAAGVDAVVSRFWHTYTYVAVTSTCTRSTNTH